MSQPNRMPSNFEVVRFVVTLCFCCALVLSLLASALRVPQAKAELVERSKQMLLAARIIHPSGYFLMKGPEGTQIPARHEGEGLLVPGTEDDMAGAEDVLQVYDRRIQSILVDDEGNTLSFEDANIDEKEYVSKNWKKGFSDLEYKIVYQINPNEKNGKDAVGYILPVAGFGLWDAIAGYLALHSDAMTVKGISWYWHKETPGLGAEISEASWQSMFPGKRVFLVDPKEGQVDLRSAPVGITVVRGTVKDTYGDSLKSQSAVDGMAGATLTGVGVTKAYKDALEAYRPFLIQVHENYKG